MVTIEEKINKLIENIDKNNRNIKDSLEELKSEIEISKNSEDTKEFAEKALIGVERIGVDNKKGEFLLSKEKLKEEIKNKENEIQELKRQLEIINLSESEMHGRGYNMGQIYLHGRNYNLGQNNTIYPQTFLVENLVEKALDGAEDLAKEVMKYNEGFGKGAEVGAVKNLNIAEESFKKGFGVEVGVGIGGTGSLKFEMKEEVSRLKQELKEKNERIKKLEENQLELTAQIQLNEYNKNILPKF